MYFFNLNLIINRILFEWICRFNPRHGESGYLAGAGDSNEGIFMLLKHIKNDKEVFFYQERLKELSRLLTGVTLETELRYLFCLDID